MRTFLTCLGVVAAVAALFVACKKKEEAPTVETPATPETAEVAVEGNVERGLELFRDAGLGTTGKTCESCHPNGGTEGMAGDMPTKPLTGVKDRYPGVFMMLDAEKEVTLAEVVNFCITKPLKGEALAEDSQEMKDLIAYLESL
jgi:cytochrome c